MNPDDFLKGSMWSISPEKMESLGRRYHNALADPEILKEAALYSGRAQDQPDYALKNGVAIIPITGPISKSATFFSRFFGGASTDQIQALYSEALADPDVEAVVFNFHTPGGTIYGIEETSDIIFAGRDIKPSVAFSDGLMCSAGIWMGTAANEIILAKTAEAGSIGVLQVHYDYSEWDKKDGLKRTYITAGKYKAIGNDAEPLSDEAREMVQGELDYLYSIFVNTVARNRGVDPHTVLTEMADGKLFIGEQAVQAGLADSTGTLDDAINRALFLAESAGNQGRGAASAISKKEAQMPEKKTQTAPATAAELEEKFPELAAELIERGKTSVDLAGASAEAVRAETERLLGLVTAQFGEDAGEKFKAVVESGVSVDQFAAIQAVNPPAAAAGAGAAGASMDKMLDAINNAGAGDPGSESAAAGAQKPETFEQAWKQIKDAEACSVKDAMSKAVDQYPALHKAYLEGVAPAGNA